MTVANVACRACVPSQTVSREIGDKGDIGHEMLENVRAVNAGPDCRLSGIATQYTLTFDLVVPDIANPFFADLVRRPRNCAGWRIISFLDGPTK